MKREEGDKADKILVTEIEIDYSVGADKTKL